MAPVGCGAVDHKAGAFQLSQSDDYRNRAVMIIGAVGDDWHVSPCCL